jgi:hypothetical protein
MTTVLKRLLLLPLLAAIYFWLVDRAVPEQGFDLPYSQFALQAASLQAGKIIIDGGENAHSAYSSTALEKALGRVTVVSADSDIIPLPQRLSRLLPALKPGDTVVLAPSWRSYQKSEIGDDYIKHAMLGDYRHFYHSLSLLQRIRFVFSKLPFRYAWTLLRENPAVSAVNITRYASAIAGKIYTRSPVVADRKPVQTNVTPQCPAPETLDDSELKSALALARHITETKQVSFVFVSPAVVANQSLCTGEQRQQLIAAMQHQLAQFGLPYLASPPLPGNCALKQSNRIHPACAERASIQLADNLKLLLTGSSVDGASDLRQRLLLQRLKHLQIVHAQKPLRIGRKIEGEELDNYVAFIKGWYPMEPWGRWSSGYDSSISIPIHERPGKLFIEGHYADGNEETAIWINNQYYGDRDIQSTILDLSTVLLNDELLEIRLRHKAPRQPSKASPNTRQIKYGLMRIELQY